MNRQIVVTARIKEFKVKAGGVDIRFEGLTVDAQQAERLYAIVQDADDCWISITPVQKKLFEGEDSRNEDTDEKSK